MGLDDLRRGEERCRGGRESRSQHRAKREVGDEDRTGTRGFHKGSHQRDALGRPAGGPDQHVDPPLDRCPHDLDAHGGRRCVHDEIGTIQLGQIAARCENAGHVEAIELVDHRVDDRAELSGSADKCNLFGHDSSLFSGRALESVASGAAE